MPESSHHFALVEELRREVASLTTANLALTEQVASLDRTVAELQARERLARDVMDNVATFISLQAPDGSVELINRRILEYTGLLVPENMAAPIPENLAGRSRGDPGSVDGPPGGLSRSSPRLEAGDVRHGQATRGQGA